MGGTSAAAGRRMADIDFMRRYFAGNGIDIGGRLDSLANYGEFFPCMKGMRIWDVADGDAQFMQGVDNDSVDFVYSSHCLEHLVDPKEGLANWFRILKPGGYLTAVVPDEDLYEQGVFPSTHNADHKWTFTIFKKRSWSPRSLNLLPLLEGLGDQCEIERIVKLDSNYRYGLARFDQTIAGFSECGIEFVLRKRPPQEVAQGGQLPPQIPSQEQLLKTMHLLEIQIKVE